MKLLNWLNDQNAPEFIDNAQDRIAPGLRHRLEELAQVPVTKMMIPRPLIMALDADVQLRRVKRLKSSKMRYFPVYKGDLDRILGWIEKSKVIEILNEGREDARLENHLQPMAKIGENAMVSELADIFLKAKCPMAVVLNDQGQTAGIATLSDFVELLFGFDVEGQTQAATPDPSPPKNYEL